MDRETISKISDVVNTEDNDEISYRDFIAACLPATEYLLEENLFILKQPFRTSTSTEMDKYQKVTCLGV